MMLFGDALLRRLVGNASLLLSGKAANGLLSLGSLALAARGLGVETFGLLILVHTYTQMLGQIVQFQSWQTILTYGTPALHERRFADLRRVIFFSIRLDLLGMAAGLIFALAGLPLAQRILGLPEPVVGMAALYVISVVFLATATPTGVLRLYDRFDLIAIQSPLASLIRLFGAAAAFLCHAGLAIYLTVWFAATALAGLILMAMTANELRRQHLLGPGAAGGEGSWRPDRSVWKFVWSTNFNATLNLAFTHFGTLAVGALVGTAAAALYRVAREIAEAMAAPLTLLTPALYPEIARLAAARDFNGLIKLMKRSALLAGLGASVTAGLLALIGPFLLTLIAGPEFSAAYGVMIVLAGAAAIRMWSLPLEPLLISAGLAGTAFVVRALGTALYIPFLIVLSMHHGILGAGWAALIATAATALGFLFPARAWLRRSRAEHVREQRAH